MGKNNQSNIDLLPYSDKQKAVLREYVSLLQELSCVNKIILFGSYARMEYRPQSDFDILAVTDLPVSREQRGELCSHFEELGADLIFYTDEQWKTSDCILIRQIRKDGLLIWKR